MSRVAFVNGRYLPHRDAAVHIEDRGFQFSDAVYEVIAVFGGRPIDLDAHFVRLDRSLGELGIAPPMSHAALAVILDQTARRNRVVDGILYLQVTRGVARREHAAPRGLVPSMVVTARPLTWPGGSAVDDGVAIITTGDLRWRRRDIKTVGLLANALAKQEARDHGAHEALLVDDQGRITEGSATNAWIVDAGGRVITRQADHDILNGVTRLAVIDLARGDGMEVVERAFTVAEAKGAAEAFLTGTTTLVLPITRIDGDAVGDGRPGPVARRLRRLYLAHVLAQV